MCKEKEGMGELEKETRALVSYMMDHNKHHAKELLDMAAKLREMGKSEAAGQIDKAAAKLDEASEGLDAALSLM